MYRDSVFKYIQINFVLLSLLKFSYNSYFPSNPTVLPLFAIQAVFNSIAIFPYLFVVVDLSIAYLFVCSFNIYSFFGMP